MEQIFPASFTPTREADASKRQRVSGSKPFQTRLSALKHLRR